MEQAGGGGLARRRRVKRRRIAARSRGICSTCVRRGRGAIMACIKRGAIMASRERALAVVLARLGGAERAAALEVEVALQPGPAASAVQIMAWSERGAIMARLRRYRGVAHTQYLPFVVLPALWSFISLRRLFPGARGLDSCSCERVAATSKTVRVIESRIWRR